MIAPEDDGDILDSSSEMAFDEARGRAQKEATARAAGARKRYRLSHMETVESTKVKRRRMNFFRSTKIRGLAGAIAVVTISAGLLEATSMKTVASRTLMELGAVILKQRHSETEVASKDESSLPPKKERLIVIPAPESPPISAREENAAAVVPSPIPGAPLSHLQGGTHDVVLPEPFQLPRTEQHLSQIPTSIDSSRSKRSPATLTPEVEVVAVASELEAAVAAARQKSTGIEKPLGRNSTSSGVFVDLPKKAPTSPSSHQLAPTEAQGPKAIAITLVRTFEGGILLKQGNTVTPYRIGDQLPDGKKLTSVDISAGTYQASSLDGSSQPLQGTPR